MSAFNYTALDSKGKKNKGVIEGDNERQVRGVLREKGLIPLEVKPVQQQSNTKNYKPSFFQSAISLNATDLALVTRQLATLVQAGLPIEEAIKGVAEQNEKGAIKSLLLAVRSKVVEGKSLAQALQDYPRAFPELYRATISAGEQSGFLSNVLERLADYTEARQALQQKITLALFYPALLTLVAITIVIGLLTYVVPKVVKVFENFDQELPTLTKLLINTSDFLQANWMVLGVGLVAVIILSNSAWKNKKIRANIQRVILKLPILAKLERSGNTARFTRTFSILMASSVPVLEAMRISATVMNNLPMQQTVSEATVKVREGSSISRALSHDKIFPPMVIQLISSGEQSGRLEVMLERASAQQERELETLIAAILGLFEPLLILAMGGIVLVIVLAILLPIFQLNQLVT